MRGNGDKPDPQREVLRMGTFGGDPEGGGRGVDVVRGKSDGGGRGGIPSAGGSAARGSGIGRYRRTK